MRDTWRNRLGWIPLRGARRRAPSWQEESPEDEAAYASHISWRIIALVVFIVLGSNADAMFTLVHLRNGAVEANPVMDMALDNGTLVFVVVKAAITSFGVLALAAIRNLRVAYVGLHGIAAAYVGLLAYHICLFVNHGL